VQTPPVAALPLPLLSLAAATHLVVQQKHIRIVEKLKLQNGLHALLVGGSFEGLRALQGEFF